MCVTESDVDLGLNTLNIFLLPFFAVGRKSRQNGEREEEKREREREREGKGFNKRREKTCPRLPLFLLLLLREVSKPLASA